MAYTTNGGVTVQLWDEGDEPEYEHLGSVEEMYHDPYSGELIVRISTEDGLYSIDIPVYANHSWNKFLSQLPEWEFQK